MPYPDELIYSTIARAGVRLGITSPKELLDEVFDDRRVVATCDLTGHLAAIARHYPAGAELSVEKLAYRHTLFPLYAPFVPEKRRRQCLQLMGGRTRGAVHLLLGVAASRTRQADVLRACQDCVIEQITRYGEPYWMRCWQVRGAEICLRHGKLAPTRLARHPAHRHAFVSLAPDLITTSRPPACTVEDTRMTERIRELLAIPPGISPTLDQWSQFYAAMAADYGCSAGRHMKHDQILDKLYSTWSTRWLESMGLQMNDSPPHWLQGIFRKHRKAFSYLEHLTVLEVFMGREWNLQDILRLVSQFPKVRKPITAPPAQPDRLSREVLAKRKAWRTLLNRYGVKQARLHGGQAVYAALYRCDRAWLLQINKTHQASLRRRPQRVDWPRRDQEFYVRLCDIRKTENLSANKLRRSRRWYLTRLGPMTTITKNMARLPLTSSFLDQHAETVSQYQVRRIYTAIQTLSANHLPLKRWRILRASGLSDLRLQQAARELLDKVK